jgi:hypothetical protein
VRAREGAARMPEELALEELGRHGRAVDGGHGPFARPLL